MKIQLDFDNISHMMNLTSNSIAQFKYKGFIKHQDLNMNLRIGYNHLITINKDHKEKRTLSTNLKNVCLKKYKEFLQDNSYFIAADFHPEKNKKFQERFTKIIPMLRTILPKDISLELDNGCLNGKYIFCETVYIYV